MNHQHPLNNLRRRSPNPNSPNLYSPQIDYASSPFLSPIPLSPLPLQTSSTYNYADPFERYHGSSPLPDQEEYEDPPTPNPHPKTPISRPSIRLVPASSTSSSPRTKIRPPRSPPIAQPQERSKSDDADNRESGIAKEVSNLRRHGTDPRNSRKWGWWGTGWWGDATEVREGSKPRIERGLPPLPLNVKKPAVESVSGESMDSRSSSSEGKIGVGLGFAAVTGMRNPFRPQEKIVENEEYRTQHSPNPSLVSEISNNSGYSTLSYISSLTSISRKSAASKRSVKSTASTASNKTLVVPFHPGSFVPGFASESEVKCEKILLDRVRSAGHGDRLTDKFPARKETKSGWTWEKWVLLFSVLIIFAYGLGGLIWAMLIMLRVQEKSDVIMVSDSDIVIFLTLSSLISLLTAMIGLVGLFLTSRPILAFYNLLLWPTLISLCLVGYTSYKRGNLQLDRKLNQTWSQFLTDEERLRIQNTLTCCGYFNPFHDATYSKKCYPRTNLPGCKSKWTRFETQSLHEFSTFAFSIIPVHLVVTVIAILFSNHVDRTFGKGLTPVHYRLRMADVRANALAVLNTVPPTTITKSRSHSSLSSSKSYVTSEKDLQVKFGKSGFSEKVPLSEYETLERESLPTLPQLPYDRESLRRHHRHNKGGESLRSFRSQSSLGGRIRTELTRNDSGHSDHLTETVAMRKEREGRTSHRH